nr:CDP-alcohol phosphatidyltransferase family protein [Alteraurantiacibacter aquimixticola]
MTAYRIAAAPVIAVMALAGYRDAFFILLIVSYITDLIDGPIARRMGLASDKGAKRDSFADGSTVLAGLLGLWLFEWETVRGELAWILSFLAIYATSAGFGLAKFRVLPAYHLYLSKIAASGAGLFVASLYLFGYSRIFFIAALVLGMLANLETILVTLRLKTFRADIGSIFRLREGE